MLRSADRAITGARNRLGTLMKKAKGGKVAGLKKGVQQLLDSLGEDAFHNDEGEGFDALDFPGSNPTPPKKISPNVPPKKKE